MSTLGELGEHEVLRRIRSWVPEPPEGWLGIGDDAAVVPAGRHWSLGKHFAEDQVLSSDAVIEGVHFHPGENPQRVGNKVAGRALSDLAAMGATPRYLLVNLEAPGGMSIDALEGLYQGMIARLNTCGAHLIGGDLCAGPRLAVHVFVAGSLPSGTASLRGGLGLNDSLYVTGSLGGSAGGKHLDFEPRLEQGAWLRDQGWATGAIDLSDGLLTDLRHLLEESGLGACLERAALPLSPGAGVEQALRDGEDYELLFGVAHRRELDFEGAWRARFDLSCTRIGTVNEHAGVLSCRDGKGSEQILEHKGFEHFGNEDGNENGTD